jgi:hypothetical protein
MFNRFFFVYLDDILIFSKTLLEQFVGRYWKAFCSLLGALVSLSSGFHPQSNGQTEWANQELEKFFHCFVFPQASNWSKFLVWADCAHNTVLSWIVVIRDGLSSFQPHHVTGSEGE